MRSVLPLFLTLRGRLILLICLATLPAILFTFYIAHNERNAELTRMEDDALHVVNLISREHFHQMAGAQSLLQWLSETLEAESSHPLTADSDFLAALLAGYPQLGNIAILSPDGEVINSAYPLSAPVNMRDYDAILRALNSEDSEVGEYVIGPIVGRPLLHLAHAVRGGDGEVSGVVFVAIDLEWLEHLTANVGLPTDHLLVITDREGMILSSSGGVGDEAFSIGRRIPQLAGLTEQGNHTVSAQINGRALSFVTAPMADIGGLLVASALPLEQIYAKANNVFYRTLGLLGLLTLFTVISVLVVEELALLRTVRALSEATQNFGEGNYTARVSIPHGYGELEDMAKAFNTMAEALALRHQEVTTAHKRLDRLTRHLQFAREAEAQRISRDLHDEVGQVLTSLKMDLANFQGKCGHTDQATGVGCMIRDDINAMREKIDHTVDFVRRLASGLRPPVLDKMGLSSAIDLLARRLEGEAPLVVEVEIGGIPQPLDWMISTTIYRIVQEALTNISRHAQASEIHIRLRSDDDHLWLEIEDNGSGFDASGMAGNSLGLIGMQERARLIGGTFSLQTSPGEGSLIKVCLPVRSNEDESDEIPAG